MRAFCGDGTDVGVIKGREKMSEIILRTEHLKKFFHTEYGVQEILRGISVDFYKSDFTVIMGESGSGKSTFLYALSGMDTPTGGKVLAAGRNLTDMSVDQLAQYRRHHCGFVFQNSCLIPGMNIMDNILISGLLGSRKKKQVIHTAEKLLEQVGLALEVSSKYPTQISGGMSQRVGIVRALINSPELLFADEPTGALDSHSSQEVMDILTSFNRSGQSIIMVTHDIKTAIRANRILYLKDGTIMGELCLEPYHRDDPERFHKVNQFLDTMR